MESKESNKRLVEMFLDRDFLISPELIEAPADNYSEFIDKLPEEEIVVGKGVFPSGYPKNNFNIIANFQDRSCRQKIEELY